MGTSPRSPGPVTEARRASGAWTQRNVLVTGGASFIGSHLVEALVTRGARVRVVDNLSSGVFENIRAQIESGQVEFRHEDLLDPEVALAAAEGMEVVFHLAADHGGRGYIDTHPVECSTNMILDGQVFKAAHRAGVEKIVFASSCCVYPTSRQMDTSAEVFLSEDLVRPPYEADDLYGWAKLMAELTLRAYHEQYGMKVVSCRYFTAYGPRCPENHAVMAMIARAFLGQDPFEVWGTGEQIRNWTYIDDIVDGTILAAEKIDDGTGVNIGTTERIRVVDCARQVIQLAGYEAEVKTLPDKPTGPLNRVADDSLSRQLLGWQPRVRFDEGLRRTFEWYFSTHDRERVARLVEHGGLMERRPAQ
jgi:nucleoside-diphosphate-sugar epimerase